MEDIKPKRPRGRPKKENRLENRITVRLDKQSLFALEDYCSRYNYNESQALRLAITQLTR